MLFCNANSENVYILGVNPARVEFERALYAFRRGALVYIRDGDVYELVHKYDDAAGVFSSLSHSVERPDYPAGAGAVVGTAIVGTSAVSD